MWNAIFSWTTLWWILTAVYAVVCLLLIGIVLMQRGKGAGFAGAFGLGGGGETVFGPRMSRSLPVKLTHILVTAFLAIAMCMSLIAGKVGRGVAPSEVAPSELQPTVESFQDLKLLGIGGADTAAEGGGDSTSTTTENTAAPTVTVTPEPTTTTVTTEDAVEEPADGSASEPSDPTSN